MTRGGARYVAGGWMVTGVLWVFGGTALAQPGLRVDDESWFVLEMQGQRCGYLHATTRRVGDEVRTRSRMQIEIARGKAKIKVIAEESFRETIDGRPLGFNHKMTMGTMPTSFHGTITEGRLKLVTEQFGVQREATHPFDPEIKFSWGQLLEQRERGLKPGTTYTVKIYEPAMKVDGAISMTIEVHGREEIEVWGKRRKLTRITATMQTPTPIPSEAWVDGDADPIVTTVNIGPFEMKMLASTKRQALGKTEAPELFLNTFVRTDRGVAREAGRVQLRLRVPRGKKSKLPDLPKTAMQTVRRINDLEAVVTIRRLDWEKIHATSKARRGRDKRMSEYLRASTVCDIDDKKIKALAKKAVRGCKTPAEKADALRRFVTRYVRDKNLDVGFATASEVARTREGDCTEHGVLLAALARAAGLPARGVSGIVQISSGSPSSDHASAFGYHMWTQVYLGGQWVDIDAALRQTDCDPTHIALTIMPLNDEGLLDSVMSLLPLLGQLEIDVLKVDE